MRMLQMSRENRCRGNKASSVDNDFVAVFGAFLPNNAFTIYF